MSVVRGYTQSDANAMNGLSEPVESLKIWGELGKGAISNTRSFDATGYASNLAKICKKTIVPPPPSSVPSALIVSMKDRTHKPHFFLF